MNLGLLKGVSAYLQDMRYLQCFRRVEENLFMCACEDSARKSHCLYFDMTRAHSGIFMSRHELFVEHKFSAPFDNKLAQCTTNSAIMQVRVDGENRILQFLLAQKEQYKSRHFWLMCEFTGKHTNVILCDGDLVVIEALRHIPQTKSWRDVRVGKPLQPLPQPKDAKITPALGMKQTLDALHAHYDTRYVALYEAKKLQVIKDLTHKRDMLQSALNALPQSEKLIESAKMYAAYGEVLFGALHTLPTHKITASAIDITDFNGMLWHLELPPHARDLQEAGNWYFAQSKKYHKKAQHLHKQIQNLQDKIAFLSDKIAFVERFGILGFEREKLAPRAKESEHIFIDGFKISLGRNARENQKILESARAEDLWFHIKDVPSAHLIIHCGKQMPPNAVIDKSAQMLVGLYAARKGVGDFVVDWTKRKFVKLSANAHVSYAKYKSLHYRILQNGIIKSC
ncbi:DUF814 domain-containing protein [Helicobacter jaachi]|uniref:DUF814 domain-containing protein n=1 Tax=Helicobacter jaachi TaxID=1677920 RepID=A0A4U8T9H7_9HELI|nr:NFACT family protein [Helicobacter jaachi]TLD96303.1 DUF814 domain-containing protein [Helicobacter jaachi]